MNISVVLPTYNEAENIVHLVPALLALPLDLRVIVVDDNSPDGTGQLADQLTTAHPNRVHIIHRAGKLGLGTAYLAGFRHAFDLNTDFILTMDADFSHAPKHIPEMAALTDRADLIIGSRYVAGGGAVDSPPLRRFISQGANWAAHLCLGLKARDCTAGFRLYRQAVLRSIPLEQIFSSGYSFLIEMLYLVEERGWRVAEAPILFHDRRLGQSKISRNEIFRAMYTVSRLAVRRILRPFRPPITPTARS